MPKSKESSTADKRSTLSVAAAQLAAHTLEQADTALSEIEKAISDAAAAGADLVVLPECAYPAYLIGSEDAYRSAKILSSKEFVKKLAAWAKMHHIQVVCGFVDDNRNQLRNAAVIIDAKGKERGRYAKSFLWGKDNDYFQPGEELRPFDTPLGKMGVFICADGRAPEIATGLAHQGAQLIAVPTCWVNVAQEASTFRNAQADFMIQGRAKECGVVIVAANKCGFEGDTPYCGMSQIVTADGERAATAPPDKPAIITAKVSLEDANPIDIPQWSMRRIFSAYEPIIPNRDELGEVKIAVAPADCLFPDPSADMTPPLEQLSADGVEVVGSAIPDPESADRLDIYCRALGMTLVAFAFVERLMIEPFGACGCIEAEHLISFAPMRIMALDGAAIVFVVGDEVNLPLLRTRAAENCIFVASATANSAVLVDPTGKVIDQTESEEPRIITATIDLRMSANKEVYPLTHIWDQRKPQLYANAFDIHERFVAPH
jgi:predicted amidohydrolase